MSTVIMTAGKRIFVVSGAIAALFVGILALTMAAPASAQLPAVCDEYDEGICIGPIDDAFEDDDDDIGPGGGGGNNGNGSGDGSGAGSGNGSGDGDGNLPFTGYPLTGLILLFLALLALGLTLRGGAALRERLARGPTSA